MNTQLNLPSFVFKTKTVDNQIFIFDELRKKYLYLSPEEWVRQNFIRYLIEYNGYNRSLIGVEHSIKNRQIGSRCDAVVYNKSMNAVMLIEFKAPHIGINQEVFDQAFVYNKQLNCQYVVVSNGLQHFCCKIDNNNVVFEKNIPKYSEL